MVNRRKAPGFSEWLIVTFTIIGAIFTLYNLFKYAETRQSFPAGMEIAGVNVGQLTRAEAEEAIIAAYNEKVIRLNHLDQMIIIRPAQAEFALDMETMMLAAEYQRDQQDFWSGFWGYIWNRAVDVEPVALAAVHSEAALRDTLQIVVDQLDQPALPPQPVPGSMSFQYGAPGIETNIEASYSDVVAALYRPDERTVPLVVEVVQPKRPDMALLQSLITNSLQEFQARTGGVASVFVIDLNTGQEISYAAQLPMSGMDLLKLPLMVEALRVIEGAPTSEQDSWLQTVATDSDFETANQLLRVIAGQDDPLRGSQLVNGSLQALGIHNTFLGCAFGSSDESVCRQLETDVNRVENGLIAPDPFFQTTAEDMGLLLAMIYDCAEHDSGALRVLHSEAISAADCQRVFDLMSANRIGSLIEEGVPPGLRIAHRHGWQSDTYADAAVVYSEGGDYVLVQFLHKPGWLDWNVSSPLMADISQAVYNFFNFDDPYLAQ